MSKPPESVLTEALRVTGERGDNYGHPLANHKRIAILWNAYFAARSVDAAGNHAITQPELEPADVATLMVLLKMARQMHLPARDNLVDMAGYVRCIARIKGVEP